MELFANMSCLFQEVMNGIYAKINSSNYIRWQKKFLKQLYLGIGYISN